MTGAAGSASVLRALCAAETCCLPMDRALTAAGFTMHPNCEFPPPDPEPARKKKPRAKKPAAATAAPAPAARRPEPAVLFTGGGPSGG